MLSIGKTVGSCEIQQIFRTYCIITGDINKEYHKMRRREAEECRAGS